MARRFGSVVVRTDREPITNGGQPVVDGRGKTRTRPVGSRIEHGGHVFRLPQWPSRVRDVQVTSEGGLAVSFDGGHQKLLDPQHDALRESSAPARLQRIEQRIGGALRARDMHLVEAGVRDWLQHHGDKTPVLGEDVETLADVAKRILNRYDDSMPRSPLERRVIEAHARAGAEPIEDEEFDPIAEAFASTADVQITAGPTVLMREALNLLAEFDLLTPQRKDQLTGASGHQIQRVIDRLRENMRRCSHGHLNAPNRRTCKQCGERLVEDASVQEAQVEEIREDSPAPFEIGDEVREADDHGNLGRFGTVDGEGIAEDGAWVYDVLWEDGTHSDAVRQYNLRNLNWGRERTTDESTEGTVDATEAVLTGKSRAQLKDSDFALPGRRYPIHDEAHARNALSRVAQHGTAAEKAKVRAAVRRRYPNIGMRESRTTPVEPGLMSLDELVDAIDANPEQIRAIAEQSGWSLKTYGGDASHVQLTRDMAPMVIAKFAALRDDGQPIRPVDFFAEASAVVDALEDGFLEASDAYYRARAARYAGPGGGIGSKKREDIGHGKGRKYPPGFQHLRNELMAKRGMSVAKASRIAYGALRRWARGGGNVKPSTRAKAQKVLAQLSAHEAWLAEDADLSDRIEQRPAHVRRLSDGRLTAVSPHERSRIAGRTRAEIRLRSDAVGRGNRTRAERRRQATEAPAGTSGETPAETPAAPATATPTPAPEQTADTARAAAQDAAQTAVAEALPMGTGFTVRATDANRPHRRRPGNQSKTTRGSAGVTHAATPRVHTLGSNSLRSNRRTRPAGQRVQGAFRNSASYHPGPGRRRYWAKRGFRADGPNLVSLGAGYRRKNGSHRVKRVQRALGMSTVDGKFGSMTKARVKRFQRRQGLQVDGIVGPQTAARLRKLNRPGFHRFRGH